MNTRSDGNGPAERGTDVVHDLRGAQVTGVDLGALDVRSLAEVGLDRDRGLGPEGFEPNRNLVRVVVGPADEHFARNGITRIVQIDPVTGHREGVLRPWIGPATERALGDDVITRCQDDGVSDRAIGVENRIVTLNPRESIDDQAFDVAEPVQRSGHDRLDDRARNEMSAGADGGHLLREVVRNAHGNQHFYGASEYFASRDKGWHDAREPCDVREQLAGDNAFT